MINFPYEDGQSLLYVKCFSRTFTMKMAFVLLRFKESCIGQNHGHHRNTSPISSGRSLFGQSCGTPILHSVKVNGMPGVVAKPLPGRKETVAQVRGAGHQRGHVDSLHLDVSGFRTVKLGTLIQIKADTWELKLDNSAAMGCPCTSRSEVYISLVRQCRKF